MCLTFAWNIAGMSVHITRMFSGKAPVGMFDSNAASPAGLFHLDVVTIMGTLLQFETQLRL